MSYQLVPEESLSQNIRRIFREELSRAISDMMQLADHPDETIHEVRKRIKKIRAVCWLVRRELGKGQFHRANKHYRNIARLMAPLREAAVLINTLDKVTERGQGILPGHTVSRVRHRLQDQKQRVSEDFFHKNKKVQRVQQALAEARQHPFTLPISSVSFKGIAGNLKDVYRGGRKAVKVASGKPGPKHFHELRKQVKLLWYQTLILTPIWPGLWQPYAQQLEQLSELLGEERDLGILAKKIKTGKLPVGRPATTVKWLAFLQAQRETLQEQMIPLARRIFAEKPARWANRFCLYGKIWQDENKLN